MKDVTEILAKRLARLEAPFSQYWISDFLSLIDYIKANETLSQVIRSIEAKKKQAHEPLVSHFLSLSKEADPWIKQAKKCIDPNATELQTSIKTILQTSLDSSKIVAPFFDAEEFYRNYCNEFHRLANLPETKYLNLSLSNSPYFQLWQQDIKDLAGLRSTAIWGHWDELLRWAEWTKNGVSPNNETFADNLSQLFEAHKLSESVQSCGLYFLECLSHTKAVTISSQPCLKSLEMFLDRDERYWIIVHFEGEARDMKPFFIKKLRTDTNSYSLIQRLMEAEDYSTIDFPQLTNVLGELEIKKELKKVFFPHQGQFAGALVHLSKVEPPVNPSIIMETLNSIEQQKKRLPSFNLPDYYRSRLS